MSLLRNLVLVLEEGGQVVFPGTVGDAFVAGIIVGLIIG
jgi:hypothetical protein